MKKIQYTTFEDCSTLEKHLANLLAEIDSRVLEAIEDKTTNLFSLHPRVIIVIFCTNIIVNLLMDALSRNLDVGVKLKLVEECLEEIKDTSLKLWSSIEASKADEKIPH